MRTHLQFNRLIEGGKMCESKGEARKLPSWILELSSLMLLKTICSLFSQKLRSKRAGFRFKVRSKLQSRQEGHICHDEKGVRSECNCFILHSALADIARRAS